MPAIRRGDHRDILALSVVIQESLFPTGKLERAFLPTTQQRLFLVRKRTVLGFSREVDGGEHLLARGLWSRIIYPVPHGAE